MSRQAKVKPDMLNRPWSAYAIDFVNRVIQRKAKNKSIGLPTQSKTLTETSLHCAYHRQNSKREEGRQEQRLTKFGAYSFKPLSNIG